MQQDLQEWAGDAVVNDELIAQWEALKHVITQIDNHIFITGYPVDSVQKRICRMRISYVLSLTRAQPPDLCGSWVYRYPFADDTTQLPRVDALQALGTIVSDIVKTGNDILVHCAYGFNRSALITGIALANLHPEWSGDQIVEHIRSKRKGALHNPLYASYLRSLNVLEQV